MHFNQRTDSIKRQQDRTVSFFDSIITISVTVMALQLAESDNLDDDSFYSQLAGYIISFIAISSVWFTHSHYILVFHFTGQAIEVVLHFLLMFLITLFQPATIALGKHRDNGRVRAVYITIFILMNMVNLILLFTLRHYTKQRDRQAERLNKQFAEHMQNNDLNEHDRLVLDILFLLGHPDASRERFTKLLPEEIESQITELNEVQAQEYRDSIIRTIIMMIFIVMAVIVMIFNIFLSYIILAAGFVFLMVFNYSCMLVHSCRTPPSRFDELPDERDSSNNSDDDGDY